MNLVIRNDSVLISGYVNAVERLSKPIRESIGGKIMTFLERVKAGVFKNALKRNDNVLVYLNHNPERVLACTKDGSAVLEEDNIGLRASITITDKEVVQKAKEGKLSGWSFGFIPNADNLNDKDNQSKLPIRTIEDLDLIEVSILDDTKEPAYYGTSIEARGGSHMKMEIRAEAFENEEPKEEPTKDEVANGEAAEEPTGEEETKAEETINIEELANMIADIIIAKVSEKEKKEDEAEDKIEKQVEEELEEKANCEGDEKEKEARSIDYSAFEKRLSSIKK